MAETIEAGGSEVTLDGMVFRSFGVNAEIEIAQKSSVPSRTIEPVEDPLLDLILQQNITLRSTIVISTASVDKIDVASQRRGENESPCMEVEIPVKPSDNGQVLLIQDENGCVKWVFPDRSDNLKTARTSTTNRYTIGWDVQMAADTRKRGLFGAIGKRLLRVLIFPLFNPLIEKLISSGIEFWEEKKRPYGIRMVTPENYRKPVEGVIGEQQWNFLSGGRALLLIHGTLNRINTNIQDMDPGQFRRLYDMYGGRVFAFEHYTLSHDPIQNTEWLLNHIPSELTLDIDIIAKSRGGLIARSLAEKNNLVRTKRNISIGKVVFVATPNAGTALADQEYLSKFIDTYTNLLRYIPGKAVDIIETVIEIAKYIAVTGMKSFPGLQAMNPGGEFLKKLNCPPESKSRYFAISSNFEPTDKKFSSWVKDNLTDAIFKTENDCVVPTAGVYSENNCPSFPIRQAFVYPPDMGINHETYFTNSTTAEKIISWLGN
jgi:hypothetical protein